MAAEKYTPERRPIASRERKISKVVAHALAVRDVSPNAISTAGMMAGVAAGLALAATTGRLAAPAFVAAAVLMQLRLLANMLDGMVAVECQRASPVGELYNEVPDRVSDTAAFVGAGYALGSHAALGFVAACSPCSSRTFGPRAKWPAPSRNSADRWPSRSGSSRSPWSPSIAAWPHAVGNRRLPGRRNWVSWGSGWRSSLPGSFGRPLAASSGSFGH